MNLITRLWHYQAERFPLGKTILLVAVFSAAGISASAHFAGRPLPSISAFLLAFIITLFFFFQLRVFDEVKDGEDDRLYRPERPIPRGLVTLRLIVWLGVASAAISLALCALFAPYALGYLLLVWGWMFLMGREFFVPHWLKAHPLLYMASHMAIMPLIDLFVTAIEWQPHGYPPQGLGLFLALSFVNGCILEIGRKLWATDNERPGVETYSGLFGPRRAALAWMGCVIIALLLLIGVGFATGAPVVTAAAGLLTAIFALYAGWSYRAAPTDSTQKRVDNAAGLWVFACYVAAGFAPFIKAISL